MAASEQGMKTGIGEYIIIKNNCQQYSKNLSING